MCRYVECWSLFLFMLLYISCCAKNPSCAKIDRRGRLPRVDFTVRFSPFITTIDSTRYLLGLYQAQYYLHSIPLPVVPSSPFNHVLIFDFHSDFSRYFNLLLPLKPQEDFRIPRCKCRRSLCNWSMGITTSYGSFREREERSRRKERVSSAPSLYLIACTV